MYYQRDHCLTSREFIIYHYWQNIILVKDVNRLVLRQYNNESNKRYFCQSCLHGCSSEEVLKNHLERCKLHGAQRIKFPEADDKKERDKVKFTKTEYQLPFVIYPDFESLLRKQDSCEPSSNPSPSNTSNTYHMEAASTWHAVMDNTLSTPSEYRGWHRWKVFGPGLSRGNSL